METKEITVRVSPAAARIYAEADAQQRAKLDLLVSLKIGEFSGSNRSLEDILEDARSQAEANGLTAEKLKDLLSET